jgi:hypothetical protein
MLQKNASRPASAAQRGAGGIVRARRVCVRGAGVLALALGLGGGVAGTSAVAALPDGRVYEQASAVKKNGSEAAVRTGTGPGGVLTSGAYASAAPGGGAVAYWQEGPAGETESGADLVSVSRRNPQTGWETSAALPPEDLANGDYVGGKPLTVLASADSSRFLFVAFGPFVKENNVSTGPLGADENLALYRTRGNSIEPEWLTRPTFEKFSQAKPEPARLTGRTVGLAGVYPAGGSADLSTVYFTYFGTLVPTDAARAPLVEPIEQPRWSSTEEYRENAIVEEANGEAFRSCANANRNNKPSATQGECEQPGVWWAKISLEPGIRGPWGFYEWHAGELGSAGELRSAGELPGELEGEVTEQNKVIKGLSSTANIIAGIVVTGAKIKAGTTVTRVISEHEVELSAPIEGSGSATVKEMLTFHGTYSPYGAVPAVTQKSTWGALAFPFARLVLNQVAQNGSMAFFISPEASHASEAGTPVELYVREQTPAGPKTVLVSRDELAAGSPAPAACPKGASSEACAETSVTPFNATNLLRKALVQEAYVYASPDGSRAFFQSKDKLAKSAAGQAPEGSGPWTYEFSTSKDTVTYLPGVVEPIAASSQDGSSFIFRNTGTKKIELWTGGPALVQVASFSTPAEPEFEGVATKDGAVFVFNTNAVLTRESQTINNSAGLLQTYRYDVSSKRLSCVSCAPQGVPQHRIEEGLGQARQIADEGRRVFFETATKLVPQKAENGVDDVYEWEQAGTGSCQSEEQEGGCVYLLSSGTSPYPSFYLDNDESGENVFFATKAGLVKGDTDESYDVYDARVGGGFPQPPPPGECAGTCRSAGAAPALSAALTATLGPPENTNRVEVLHEKSEEKPLTRAQKLAKALKACARKPKRKRAACIKRARRLYGAKATSKTHAGRRRG